MVRRRSRGEGSIYRSESKGLWVAKITLPDGQRRVKYSKSQKVVREWLLESQNALRLGMLASDDSVTVAEFLTNYMETVVKHNLRPKTIEANLSLTRIHIIPALGKIRLSQLRPDHLQSLYAEVQKKGLSKRTAQYIHAIIHKSLKQAQIWGFVPRNVADLVTPPKPEKRPPTVYNKEQVEHFLETVKGERFHTAYVIAIYGGLREGEVLGLYVEDCDLKRRVINISRSVQYQIGNGVVVTDLKTKTSRRAVKMPEVAIPILKSYLNQLNKNQGLLFTTDSGKPVNPRFLVLHFKDAIKRAGLPDIRFQDLRHTSASLLLVAGVHPKVVQERLGHSSIVLTMDTYSHLIPGIQDRAAEELDKMFGHP